MHGTHVHTQRPSDRKGLGDGGTIEARFLPDSFQTVSYCIACLLINIWIMESEHNKFNKARDIKDKFLVNFLASVKHSK